MSHASSTCAASNQRHMPSYDISSDVEVVEDSEPEREERRKQVQLEKKLLQKTASTSNTLRLNANSTPPVTATLDIPTLSMSAASSAISNNLPDDYSQNLPVSLNTPKISSAHARQVAPPPWVVKEAPAPGLPARGSPEKPQRTKSSSQPSPVKQLDINSFAFHRRPSGARSTSHSTSRSASSSRLTDREISGPSKTTTIISAKPSAASKTFCLSATDGPSSPDASFSSEQITSLTSCVVCGNHWTVRKQAKSKWSHITTCARKNGCENDVLYLKLIAAVVEATDEKALKAKKAKEKSKDKDKELAGPQSLLSHIVQERAPTKRRGRKKEPAPSSLLPVEEARRTILRQSIHLLGDGIPQQDENEPQSVAPTQQEESDDEPRHIPATQAFAPSRIGGPSKFFGSTMNMLSTDLTSGLLYADEPRSFFASSGPVSRAQSPQSSVSEDHVRISPLTQPFLPTLSANSSIISIQSSDEDSVLSGVEYLDNGDGGPECSESSSSVIVLESPGQRPISPLQHEGLLDHQAGWDSQEGVYRWEDYAERAVSPASELSGGLLGLSIRDLEGEGVGPELRGHSLLRSPNPVSEVSLQPSPPSLPKEPKSSNKLQKAPSSSSDGPLAVPLPKSKSKAKLKFGTKGPSSPLPPKKRGAKKTIVHPPEQAEDEAEESAPEDIAENLLNMITNDEQLYLRILRYEPIKFEDILEMAIANSVPKRGLQIKLKAFLDSQPAGLGILVSENARSYSDSTYMRCTDQILYEDTHPSDRDANPVASV